MVTDDTAQLPATTIVTTPDLRVRIAPNTTAVEIGRLTRGEEVRVVQRSAEKVPIGKHNTYWYKVTASNGLTGWVYGAHLALEADGKELQAVDEQYEKKLRSAITGRWEMAKPTGVLTSYFVTLMPDGQVEFGTNRKGLQYGRYSLELSGDIAKITVTGIEKPMVKDLKAKFVGETLVFTATMNNDEYRLNLAEKTPELFRDQEKKEGGSSQKTTGQ